MINVFHLKCFYDTVLMGSASEAARRNFISQPAVSKAIKSLEEALGVKLFHRQHQQLKLTAEGDVVFAKAQGVFASFKELKDELDRCQKEPSMPLHFVSTQSIALSLLPNFLPEFKQAHPGVDLHFLLGGLSQIKGWLQQGIMEFALVLESDQVSEYQQYPLYSGQFRLYRHVDETREVSEAPLYVEHRGGFLVEEYEKKMHLDLTAACELNSWELIARTLETQGAGYGLLPDIVVSGDRADYLVPASSLSLPYTVIAIFPRGKTLSFSAQTFLEQLISSFQK